MSDTENKVTVQSPEFVTAGSLALSHPSELLRTPAETMARSLDSTLGGRRVVLSRHTGGSHEWLVDNTATGGVTQAHPDAVSWRRVAFARFEQQAGTALVVRVIYVPSGASEFFGLATWDLSGVGGQVRVVVDWDIDGSSATTTVERTLDGEEDADGAELQEDQHTVATIVRPPNAPNDFAKARTYSEWVTTTLAVEDRGGARVIHVSVTEVPVDHVALHDDEEPTLTGSKSAWETNRPQIEAPDGATYEEHRYGSFRGMQAAARQSARVGPIIAQWSAYSERDALPADTDVTPRTTTSATFVRISRGTNTAWDTDEVGWFVMGTQRAPEHLSTRISGAGSVPVLIRVEARFAGVGAVVGVCRFQSSDRVYIDVNVDQAVVGTTWTVVTQRGWLEASVVTDDFWPVLQDFFHTDGAEQLEVRSFTVSYGDYSVGA
jgi:hypothetical protein